MAARTRRLTVNEKTREKIRTTQIVNRLVNHALGKNKMSQTQVQAATVLLRKTLPDLSMQEIQQSIDLKVEEVKINFIRPKKK